MRYFILFALLLSCSKPPKRNFDERFLWMEFASRLEADYQRFHKDDPSSYHPKQPYRDPEVP